MALVIDLILVLTLVSEIELSEIAELKKTEGKVIIEPIKNTNKM